MREADLLNHIFSLAGGINAASGDVLVGPGDDCAVVRTPSGDVLLLTVDQVVEGRHFEPGTPVDLIARKAIARSLSDIAAMGGTPAWALASAVLPEGYSHGRELADSLHAWGRHWECPIVGGDIAAGPAPLTIGVSVVGRMDRRAGESDGLGETGEAAGKCRWKAAQGVSSTDRDGVARGPAPVLRSGARAGDELWLTGRVGGSVESGWHLRFEPRLEAGRAAAWSGVVHAMIDLSDGLGRDAARVGVASGVRLEIDATRLPISRRARDWRQAAGEGEDYELLMAIAPRDAGGVPLPTLQPPLLGPIGTVRACAVGERPGATIVDPHGTAHDAQSLGWDHGS